MMPVCEDGMQSFNRRGPTLECPRVYSSSYQGVFSLLKGVLQETCCLLFRMKVLAANEWIELPAMQELSRRTVATMSGTEGGWNDWSPLNVTKKRACRSRDVLTIRLGHKNQREQAKGNRPREAGRVEAVLWVREGGVQHLVEGAPGQRKEGG